MFKNHHHLLGTLKSYCCRSGVQQQIIQSLPSFWMRLSRPFKISKIETKKAVRFSELGVCRNEDALKHKVVALGSLLTATLGRKSPWKRLTLLVVLLHVHLSCRCCSTTLWRATLATKSSPCCRCDVTGVATTTFWRTFQCWTNKTANDCSERIVF